MKYIQLLTILCTFIVTGCQSTQPRAEASEYFVTEGGGIMIDNSELNYAMTYKLIKNASASIYAVVEFENPKPGGSPLVAKAILKNGAKKLLVQSPKFKGIRNNRSYSTILRAYSDANHTNLITTHKQAIQFSAPSVILKQRGISEY